MATLVAETVPSGTYRVGFDASRLSSGVYYYQLEAGDFRHARSMVIMK